MWKCVNCGNEADGLFCANCGAPMTEEGEKLDLQPVDQEPVAGTDMTTVEPEDTKPTRTFRDIFKEIVLSKMYMAVMILSIIGFAYPIVANFIGGLQRNTLSLDFDISSLLLMISLIATYQAAKRDFSIQTKFFGCMRASLIIRVVAIVFVILMVLFMGLGLTMLTNVPQEDASALIDVFFENATITDTATGEDITELVDETMTSVLEAMGIDNTGNETIGSLMVSFLQYIKVILWVMLAVVVAIAIFIMVVCLMLSRQVKVIQNKVFAPTTELRFNGFAITVLQVFAVMQMISGVTDLFAGAFILSCLVTIGVGASTFMIGSMARKLKVEYAAIESEEAESNV